MKIETLKNTLGKVDIYLLDQVMKNRFDLSDNILDVGCGGGRNLSFLHRLGFNISGCDKDELIIQSLREDYPHIDLKIAFGEDLPYTSKSFDHLICNAVLHFANSHLHFTQMIDELYRVVRNKGSVFIRMTSVFGIEQLVKKEGEQYLLPDGSHRFLLETKQLNYIQSKFDFIEPLKTVNVNNLRCMSTLVLSKK